MAHKQLQHFVIMTVLCHFWRGTSAGILPQASLTSPLSLPQTHIYTSATTATATSHQSFTRIHSPDIVASQLHALPPTVAPHTPAAIIKTAPATTTSYALATPTILKTVAYVPMPQPQAHTTPIVSPLTHTPAHLTFAATPIVYKMLPQIKPVRAISYDSLKTSAQGYQLIHQ